MKKIACFLLFSIALIFSCAKENTGTPIDEEVIASKELTIFFINDQHGQLDNFSKIKHIIDQEKLTTNVITACSGDIFSGNPIVDNHNEKGFPMIDMMNRVGFDISVIGNHEFDYGEAVLADRMQQSNFEWVCANVDMSNSVIPAPEPYKTIVVDDLRITFLGLLETNGSDIKTIPSTHPKRVENVLFERPENSISEYTNIKAQEDADLYIALTHIGYSGGINKLGDFQIANDFPFFDLIIGGHSHQRINSKINDIPIYQSGSNLNHLGKIKLVIKDKSIESINFEFIDLNSYSEEDVALKELIDTYNDEPYFYEIIGSSQAFHDRPKVGCFYTDALRGYMNVDIAIQNNGGIRSGLNEGDITRREIFEISPFNNGTLIYEMTVAEIKEFFIGSQSGFYYSGIQIEQEGSNIEIRDLSGDLIDDATVLSLGTNDYIPAVHENYFPSNGTLQPLTAAETLMAYLENINSEVHYTSCEHFFRYQ